MQAIIWNNDKIEINSFCLFVLLLLMLARVNCTSFHSDLKVAESIFFRLTTISKSELKRKGQMEWICIQCFFMAITFIHVVRHLLLQFRHQSIIDITLLHSHCTYYHI